MNGAAWIERLNDAYADGRTPPLIRRWQGAASLTAAAAAEPQRLAENSGWVAVSTEENTTLGAGTDMVMRRDMLVVIALRDVRERGGEMNDLEAAVEATRRALIGWLPPGAASRVEFVRGGLMDFGGGVIWWQMTFRSAEVVRGEC